jgi:hypothetical protein
MLQKPPHNLIDIIGGMMKYKVLRDFATTDGVLYSGETVKQWNAAVSKDNIRVKDTMGRIWNVPVVILKKLVGGS